MEEAEIKELVGRLLKEGKGLNEILNYLRDEEGVSLTYLDLRMIAAEVEEEAPPEEPAEEETPSPEPDVGGPQIEFDTVMQPGAELSGTAALGSGAKLRWLLGADGRLQMGLEPGSSQPTEPELVEFQQKLIETLQQRYGQM